MKPLKFFWSRTAGQDLQSIVDFIALDKPRTALKILRKIRLGASALGKNPKMGRCLPEFHGLKSLPFREIIISPWRVVYRVQNNTVEVLSVLDSRRDLEDILFERLTGSSRLP